MKKTMVYSISALLCLSALAGCGRMEGESIYPTERPVPTASPMIVTPDPEDGYVRDEDGIITDGDTGRDRIETYTPRPTTQPGTGAVPGSSTAPSASPKPAGTAAPKASGSPSPSPANGMNMS